MRTPDIIKKELGMLHNDQWEDRIELFKELTKILENNLLISEDRQTTLALSQKITIKRVHLDIKMRIVLLDFIRDLALQISDNRDTSMNQYLPLIEKTLTTIEGMENEWKTQISSSSS